MTKHKPPSNVTASSKLDFIAPVQRSKVYKTFERKLIDVCIVKRVNRCLAEGMHCKVI